MNSAELLQRVREMLRDTSKPYLFSDESIYRYLAEAQERFCVATHILIDGSTYTIDTTANVAVYDVDKHILRTYGAMVVGQNQAMQPFSAHPRTLAYNRSRGMPVAFATDYGMRTVAFYPVPDAAYTIELIAAVRPLEPLSESVDPVIPEEYAHILTYYACAKLTAQIDSDAGNPRAAKEFDEQWWTAVRDVKRTVYTYRTGERVMIPSIT
jgi:hypothetical protein